jgi:hypothetical protein
MMSLCCGRPLLITPKRHARYPAAGGTLARDRRAYNVHGGERSCKADSAGS